MWHPDSDKSKNVTVLDPWLFARNSILLLFLTCLQGMLNLKRVRSRPPLSDLFSLQRVSFLLPLQWWFLEVLEDDYGV